MNQPSKILEQEPWQREAEEKDPAFEEEQEEALEEEKESGDLPTNECIQVYIKRSQEIANNCFMYPTIGGPEESEGYEPDERDDDEEDDSDEEERYDDADSEGPNSDIGTLQSKIAALQGKLIIAQQKAAAVKPINNFVCPHCDNHKCSKEETNCWSCGESLHG